MSSDVRMLVKVESSPYDYDHKFFHVIGKPVRMSWEEDTQEWMPYGSFYTYQDEPFYDNLQVHSQGDVESGNVYGYDIEYRDVIGVNLQTAEKMIKVLRSVDRKLEKIQSELGYPQSFSAYLARAGKAMGISQYGFLPVTGRTFPSGASYAWHGATMIDAMVAERIKHLRTQAGVEVAP